MASEDSEITLGTWHLLGLFLLLAAICGVFFSIGYSVGKSTAREQTLGETPSQVLAAAPAGNVPKDGVADGKSSAPVTASGDTEPKAGQSAAKPEPAGNATPASNLTFYKAVQQSSANLNHSPAKPADAPAGKDAPGPVSKAAPESAGGKTEAVAKPEPTPATMSHAGPVTGPGTIVVQIAALTREDDAVALAGALRKKGYDVFVVNNPAMHDKFYHVQVGPFTTMPDANAMKARLTDEGYNPIIKK